MGKFIVNILMCFVSVILLFFAPDVYSYVYCLLLLFIYILFNIIYLLQDHKNRIFSFEFLFMGHKINCVDDSDFIYSKFFC